MALICGTRDSVASSNRKIWPNIWIFRLGERNSLSYLIEPRESEWIGMFVRKRKIQEGGAGVSTTMTSLLAGVQSSDAISRKFVKCFKLNNTKVSPKNEIYLKF